MRYRPFARSGGAVSALSLALTDRPMRPEERVKLIYAALEAGINTFELQSRDPEVGAALGEALSAIERRMVFVALRIGWSRDRNGKRVRDLTTDGLTGAIEAALASTRLDRLDVAIFDTLESEVLPPHVVPSLQSAQQAGRVRMLGIAGAEGADPHIGSGVFEVLETPFNVHSGWIERNRLKRAVEADMAVVGTDFHPFNRRAADKPAAGPLGLRRLLGGDKSTFDGPYTFLERTPGWTAEEACLAFALTEPSLTTVQTRSFEATALQKLAAAVERDLPNGLSAQIEMARFSTHEKSGAA
ncbi:MAG TPA: aldo/keto reductase [Caulobacteraceae bacterium]|jgi:aryl-alcohol dehydrogenase-like predicted oxidoreductase|nr:aldo/keto reductase [Caulobacteraceae bacterium]